jgi:hypothetical protein
VAFFKFSAIDCSAKEAVKRATLIFRDGKSKAKANTSKKICQILFRNVGK